MTMLVYMVGRNIPLYGIDIDAYSNVNVDAQSMASMLAILILQSCRLTIQESCHRRR